ncbi:BceA [Caballeronia novacaledonica]|uniref:BceA n=1 Tax=Caballeronia novacaledonica TaxID=1544861 RepID=A0A2U3IAB1_9BURK|nr:BceA [Caballeronia novacaledonica]
MPRYCHSRRLSSVDDIVDKSVRECIESGWIASDGAFVERFEQAMARYVGRKHAIAVANGSAALGSAALELGPDDEVIIATHTIISCASTEKCAVHEAFTIRLNAASVSRSSISWCRRARVFRCKCIIIVRATALVTQGDNQFLPSENESTYIPLGVRHRLENSVGLLSRRRRYRAARQLLRPHLIFSTAL